MEIHEAKELKLKYEEDIQKLINDFMFVTGIKVTDINYYYYREMGSKKIVSTNIDLQIEL